MTHTQQNIPTMQALARQMLRELQFAVHRAGYRHLCIAIPLFALDDAQSLSKELYPRVAEYYSYPNWHAVEHSIRVVILDAWERRDPEVWAGYFPDERKPPSNKQFIATLAERLK
ncbi:MAG: sporulation initiation factor Spo0A C-terminal domain-containing protein [Oscillospiraceae bacterium]|nr:sporulation initiation factor Spo0A C-terminal domain-containing protein [Oscillospiraceae bacterium]